MSNICVIVGSGFSAGITAATRPLAFTETAGLRLVTPAVEA